MIWHDFEMMARGGTLALLALWSLLLWRDHRKLLAARITILMNIGISTYVLEGTGAHAYPSHFHLLGNHDPAQCDGSCRARTASARLGFASVAEMDFDHHPP